MQVVGVGPLGMERVCGHRHTLKGDPVQHRCERGDLITGYDLDLPQWHARCPGRPSRTTAPATRPRHGTCEVLPSDRHDRRRHASDAGLAGRPARHAGPRPGRPDRPTARTRRIVETAGGHRRIPHRGHAHRGSAATQSPIAANDRAPAATAPSDMLTTAANACRRPCARRGSGNTSSAATNATGRSPTGSSSSSRTSSTQPIREGCGSSGVSRFRRPGSDLGSGSGGFVAVPGSGARSSRCRSRRWR